MANSAVFLCSAFLQVNYQGLAGNYPAITQCSGELPVIYLTANNTKSRTRRELHNRTSWGTCKWKKNAVTAARVQGSGQGCQMGTRMSPGSALSLHVELFPARVNLVHGNVKGWRPHSWPCQGEAQGCGTEENPVLPAPGEVLDSGMVGRL